MLGVGECFREASLSHAVWGLESFCSPLPPDLHPPDSSPVTNLDFPSI